ncbi:ATPase, T2SS/T4P/T4SS family [Noviherbaspirillum saxi]|uniref:Secretion system protein E n=1 Tax=Noviherbaspirillum saxi TaxID=2320863 RepID=A0A3A3FGA4_9BURK|nr:ATPase, T2SS/T4P/T4SS family [Noviherbaspirillum saxi]RJF92127.1 secretion system protein E [Noviherbaspirillum saxi]
MLDATKVAQLSFSDVYLGHPVLGDLLADVPGAGLNPLRAGASLREDLDRLTQVCRQTRDASIAAPSFKVAHDGAVYRVSVLPAAGGEVFVLRRIEDAIRGLAETGIPSAYLPRLMDRDLSGLFIISGAAKAGKTTTACALIKARLQEYGGIAVTAEDPIELPLEGAHRDGVCYQTPATRENGGYAEAFRRCMRWGAKTIFVGEIAEREIAAEVLQASVNGRLIISTMQAGSVVKTITRLQALANERLDPGCAQAMLADGLAGVLHQRFASSASKKLETEFLYLKDATAARASIRQGRFEVLTSEIRQQVATMIVENATFRHVGK